MRRFSRPLFMMLTAIISAVTLVAAPRAARSDDKPADTKPAPAAVTSATPELDALKLLVGPFNCDGTLPETPTRPELKYKARFVSRWVLDKAFVAYQYSRTKSKEVPLAVTREGHLGWDIGLKRYLFGGADNSGVAFLLRADPAAGDRFTFKGTATAFAGRHVPVVWTFEKTDKGFSVSAQVTDGDGQLVTQAQETCVRAAR